MKFDCIVVGAGICGLSAARYLADRGYNILIVEQTKYIGGLCREGYFKNTRYSLFGAHIFHTNDEEVWSFLSRFTDWTYYTHFVKSFCFGKLWNIPIDQKEITSEYDKLILNNMLYENYTKKMWGQWYDKVKANVMFRISQKYVRYKDEKRYFTDKYQALPSEGYNALFDRMTDMKNIAISLNNNFDINFVDRDTPVIYTGRIDKLLGENKLPFLSMNFRYKFSEPFSWSNEYGVINFPQDYDFIRAHSSKILYQQETKHDVIVYDYPGEAGVECYPIVYPETRSMYYDFITRVIEKYPNVVPCGRAGDFLYLDMDAAVKDGILAATRVAKMKGK